MPKGGRLILTKVVLTAAPIHTLLATELPKQVREAIVERQRSFFWGGQRDSNGGNCLVAWRDDCRPVELASLGTKGIKKMDCALRASWPWLRRVDPTRPWAIFPLKINRNITSLVHAATKVILGEATHAKFRTDRWIDG